MRILVISFILFLSVFSYGQQLPQYTQWSFHQMSFNPALAGIQPCIDIHTLYRTQWVGFDGAPKTGNLTVSIPLRAKRREYLTARHGIGFKFENDQIGQFSSNRANMAYAAHFNFNRDDRLSLGIYGGVAQLSYDPSQTITNDIDPEVYNNANFISGDATFGALYKTENYYFGLSMQNLIPSKWESIGTDSRWRFHTNLNAGYRFKINEDIALLPVALIKIPPRGPLAVDVNVHMDYKNFLTFGLGYRNVDAAMAFFNIRLFDQLTIGYSFDFTTSDIRLVSKNTHEVSLRFTTCKQKRVGSADCPLFE